jgi:hypothetical protein
VQVRPTVKRGAAQRVLVLLLVLLAAVCACGGHVAGELPDEECPKVWDSCPSYNCHCENTVRVPIHIQKGPTHDGQRPVVFCDDAVAYCRSVCKFGADSYLVEITCVHSADEFLKGPFVQTAKAGEPCSIANDGKGTPRKCESLTFSGECCGKSIRGEASLQTYLGCPRIQRCPNEDDAAAVKCEMDTQPRGCCQLDSTCK